MAYKEHIDGGLASGKDITDFDPEALAKGTKVEFEHTDNEEIASEIAMDHLTEDPEYYDKLEAIEKQARYRLSQKIACIYRIKKI